MTNQERINQLYQQWKDDPSSYDEGQAQHIQDWLRDTGGEGLDDEWVSPQDRYTEQRMNEAENHGQGDRYQ